MNIYILNIALIVLGAIFFLDMFRDTKAKKIYFILVTIQLALVVGLRANIIGIDTINYGWIFKQASLMNLKDILYKPTEIEKGYMIFQYIVSRFSTDFNVFLTIVSFIFMSSIGFIIYKNSPEPCLSFIFFIGLGFYTFSMTGVRQTLALAIVLFSFEFIKKRKIIPFILIVLLASSIHFSAIVFLPAYFIAYKKITKLYVVMASVTIPASFLFKESIFSFLSKVSGYGYEYFENEGPYVLIILMITVFIAGFIQRESVLERDPDNIIFYNMSLVSIILGMLTFVNPSALRAAYYYHMYLILFIPEIIMSIKDRKLRRIIYGISLIVIILLEIRGLQNNTSLVPYMFFWQ